MQLIYNLGTGIMIAIVLILIVGFAFVQYRKSERERMKKMDRKGSLLVFTEAEYKQYKKQAEAVLNNTTVGFVAQSEKQDKTNLYYSTILAGDKLIKEQKFSISDVGEV